MVSQLPTNEEMDMILEEVERLPKDSVESLAAYEAARRTLGLDSSRRFFDKTWKWAQRVAAILLLPLVAGLVWLLVSRSRVNAPVWTEIISQDMQIRELTLSDGTRLTLNAGSRVTYPETFFGDYREIFLDGEVIAEVAKDSDHPFIIHSGDIDVQVLGTKFDLKSYKDSDFAELYLLEGSVKMDVNHDKRYQSTILSPGEFVQYDRTNGTLDKKPFKFDGALSFNKENHFSFRNLPLKDVVLDYKRAFGKNIVIMDETVANSKIYAFFSNGESLEEMLGAIASTMDGIHVDRAGDSFIIGK